MTSVVLVVDVANVMGSRPDRWWKDRAGAAARLVMSLVPLAGQRVPLGPDGAPVHVARVVAVVEGRARAMTVPDDVRAAVEVLLAAHDGDTAVVEVAIAVLAPPTGAVPLVATADRGLRERLPAGSLVTGPRALLDLLGPPGPR
ncbi:hypothetical protein [Kineosporia sp. A_224]|uniref:hypothetical protein n=1 Tax=Kineosporia sp. A_224 TaxID=1962180 RepID=UPI0018E9B2C7|nr:hypothetical protein [Kineosporia sp. A_224]